jgi:hypothetical protein
MEPEQQLELEALVPPVQARTRTSGSRLAMRGVPLMRKYHRAARPGCDGAPWSTQSSKAVAIESSNHGLCLIRGARYQIAADDRQQPPPGATRSRHQQPSAASTGRQVVVAGPASSNETRNTKHETKNGKREWGWESCSHTGPPPHHHHATRHTPHATPRRSQQQQRVFRLPPNG